MQNFCNLQFQSILKKITKIGRTIYSTISYRLKKYIILINLRTAKNLVHTILLTTTISVCKQPNSREPHIRKPEPSLSLRQQYTTVSCLVRLMDEFHALLLAVWCLFTSIKCSSTVHL